MIIGNISSLNTASFSPYGRYISLVKEHAIIREDYKKYVSAEAVISRPLKLGITVCNNDEEFVIDSMERHLSTEEVIFAGSKPIILSVANSDSDYAPRTEDVKSFMLNPGDFVVIKPGIWHDACHAEDGETLYYFLSNSNGDPSETRWVNVIPEPVKVKIRGTS